MSAEKTDQPFPTEDHKAMEAALDINSEHRVLDVGSGHNPFARADVVADINFDLSLDRDGIPGCVNLSMHRYVKADITALPFKDNAFDAAVCIHVLEHISDPAAACRELIRVARRGYIETPSKSTEYFAGHPTHKWLVSLNDNVLCFEPITYFVSPYLNAVWQPVWNSPDLFKKAGIVHRDISCVQFTWEKSFKFSIQKPAADNFSNFSGETEVKRHYAFARNLLYWSAEPQHGLSHAQYAAKLSSEKKYQQLYAFYLMLSGKWLQAFKHGLPFRLIPGALWALFNIKFSQLLKKWYTFVNKRFPIQ